MITMTIRKTLREGGIDAIRKGDIYERKALTEDQIAALNLIWKIRPGKIQDAAHRGVEVVQFVEVR
jgi:hypothetical protein